MRIAVCAASGQLGSALVRELVSRIGSENVLALARTPEKVKHPGVEVRKADYDHKKDFLQALAGVETVLIVSGMSAPDVRVQQHRNIIEAARECGVRKLVYTSIGGRDGSSTFDPIVSSNRQTEMDVRDSGLIWSIGRNGLYIEPDVEYLENYRKEGKIANCAGEGLCSYTTREELAFAYSQMILNDKANGKIFNLCGEALSQQALAGYLNLAFGTSLVFEDMDPEAYLEFQKEHNGEYLGPIIAGIYSKIRKGEFMMRSDFTEAAGRSHITWGEYFAQLKNTGI